MIFFHLLAFLQASTTIHHKSRIIDQFLGISWVPKIYQNLLAVLDITFPFLVMVPCWCLWRVSYWYNFSARRGALLSVKPFSVEKSGRPAALKAAAWRRSNTSREYTPLQLQMLLRTHTDLLVIWAIDYPTILFGNQHFWLLTWYVTLKFLTDQEFKQATHNWELRLESKLHIQLHFFLSFLSMGNVTNIDVLFPLVGWLIEGFVYPFNNR